MPARKPTSGNAEWCTRCLLTRIAAGMLLVLHAASLPAAAVIRCVGDCDDKGDVAVTDLVRGLNIALGTAPLAICPNFDINGDGTATIDELTAAVENVLNGCFPLVPANDACVNAVEIAPDLFPQQFSAFAAAASVDPTDPLLSCACASNAHSVWFRMTPARDGVATLDFAGSDYDLVAAVSSGACGSLAELTCAVSSSSDQPKLSLSVQGGIPYTIEVASRCATVAETAHVAVRICGDGIVSPEEECDDGNLTDGDGCDQHCRYEGLAGIDQSCSDVPSSGFALGPGTALQQFTPTRPLLGAVDILLANTNAPHEDTVTLSIYEEPLAGAMLAAVSAHVTRDGTFWQHFAFEPALRLTPGVRYMIAITTTNPTFFLSGLPGTCYIGGDLILGNTPAGDTNFRTYAGVAP